MEIDAFFNIGKDHKICDDYTIFGFEPYPFVLLSDGCSSNKFTDIGSRVLTSIAKKNLFSFTPDNYIDYLSIVLEESRSILSLMGLDKSALNATLILIIEYQNKIYALLLGDGCLIYQTKDNINHYIKHEYSDNFPFYLNYLKADIKDTHSLEVIKDGIESIKPFKEIELYEFNKSDLNWIVGSTDGIFSFSNGASLIDFDEMINSVSDFKSFKGEFIERKLKRITKNLNKEGFFNSDDWSLGGIYLGDENDSIC